MNLKKYGLELEMAIYFAVLLALILFGKIELVTAGMVGIFLLFLVRLILSGIPKLKPYVWYFG